MGKIKKCEEHLIKWSLKLLRAKEKVVELDPNICPPEVTATYFVPIRKAFKDFEAISCSIVNEKAYLYLSTRDIPRKWGRR